MAIALIILMVLFFTVRKLIGVDWIVWSFELLLLTVLLRRLDEIANSLGFDLLDQYWSIALSWVVVIILSVTLVKLLHGRDEFKRREKKILERERVISMNIRRE